MEFYLSGPLKQLGLNCTAYGAGISFLGCMFLRCSFITPLFKAWHMEEVVLMTWQLDGFLSDLELIGADQA